MLIHDKPEHKTTQFWVRTESDRVAVTEGCYFDFAAATKVREFARRFIINHTGEWAGKPFELTPWQWFDFIAPLYGWKLPDGRRRFRRFGVGIPKKNGKSTLSSMLCKYALIADREPNAEVYLCSSTKEQARIVFREAEKFIKASKRLQRYIRVRDYFGRMESKRDSSFLQILANENKGKHGFNSHFTLFDEFHEQRDWELWNTLRYAGDARRQPLIGWISTMGFDPDRPWAEEWEYAKAVISGAVVDISYLPVIYETAPDADPSSEETWKRANPSLGVTLRVEEFRAAFQEAKNKGGITFRDFCILKLNQRGTGGTDYIARDVWDACKVPGIEVKPGDCWAGLDLASTRDLNALALVSWDGEHLDHEVEFYCPADIPAKESTNEALYRKWADAGFLTRLPGEFINWDELAKHVIAKLNARRPRKVLVDPHNASRLVTLLMEAGFQVETFTQNHLNYNEPMRELERLASAGLLRHQGNQVMSWNVGNVVVNRHANGYVMPDKGVNRLKKIDGVPASLMALGEAIKHVPKKSAGFVSW